MEEHLELGHNFFASEKKLESSPGIPISNVWIDGQQKSNGLSIYFESCLGKLLFQMQLPKSRSDTSNFFFFFFFSVILAVSYLMAHKLIV